MTMGAMELYPIQYVCTGILPEGLAWRTSSGSWHFWLPIARFLVQLYALMQDPGKPNFISTFWYVAFG